MDVLVVDANGTLVPDATDLVNFTVTGPGRLAAVDSFDINSHEPYQASQRAAFQGMCQALVKATAAGTISLTASSGSLKSGKVALTVRR